MPQTSPSPEFGPAVASLPIRWRSAIMYALMVALGIAPLVFGAAMGSGRMHRAAPI